MHKYTSHSDPMYHYLHLLVLLLSGDTTMSINEWEKKMKICSYLIGQFSKKYSKHDCVQVIAPSLGLCDENSKQLILIYQISLRTGETFHFVRCKYTGMLK